MEDSIETIELFEPIPPSYEDITEDSESVTWEEDYTDLEEEHRETEEENSEEEEENIETSNQENNVKNEGGDNVVNTEKSVVQSIIDPDSVPVTPSETDIYKDLLIQYIKSDIEKDNEINEDKEDTEDIEEEIEEDPQTDIEENDLLYDFQKYQTDINQNNTALMGAINESTIQTQQTNEILTTMIDDNTLQSDVNNISLTNQLLLVIIVCVLFNGLIDFSRRIF